MTAVRAHEVGSALKARGPEIGLVLFYGPDQGLVSERARETARGYASDPDDAFQLIRLDGDTVADTPGRLVEEATTFGLFGGRRAIWVRPTSRSIAPAVAACLDVPLQDTLVVIEAGDLAKNHALRTLCETSKRALACPCYGDEGRDLGEVVTEALATRGLSIDRDARDLLVESLGGNRLATRGELEKLALYMGDERRISVEHIDAVVTDVSAVSIDGALDAAFGGDPARLGAELGLLRERGTAPEAMLALAQRHTLALLAARARFDQDGDLDGALRSWRGMRFQRRKEITAQLRRWSIARLRRVAGELQATTLQGRMNARLAEPAIAAVLLRIASAASTR